MKLIEVKMRKDLNLLMEYFLGLTAEENVWFFITDKVVNYLLELADGEDELSNLLEIQIGNLQILAGPHTTGWWRIYWMKGNFSFREPANPAGVVFMQMED